MWSKCSKLKLWPIDQSGKNVFKSFLKLAKWFSRRPSRESPFAILVIRLHEPHMTPKFVPIFLTDHMLPGFRYPASWHCSWPLLPVLLLYIYFRPLGIFSSDHWGCDGQWLIYCRFKAVFTNTMVGSIRLGSGVIINYY